MPPHRCQPSTTSDEVKQTSTNMNRMGILICQAFHVGCCHEQCRTNKPKKLNQFIFLLKVVCMLISYKPSIGVHSSWNAYQLLLMNVQNSLEIFNLRHCSAYGQEGKCLIIGSQHHLISAMEAYALERAHLISSFIWRTAAMCSPASKLLYSHNSGVD